MRILFCDDDPEILTRLQEYVAEYFDRIEIELPECAAYSSGESLLQCENRADIAFLDVEMLGISGIRVGAELKKRNPEIKILVVTSYPDYLDEAMRFQVFRYLSKPIDKNRLFRNLKDALYQYNMATQQYAIPLENGVETRNANEIILFESNQRRSIVHTTSGVLYSTASMEHWRNVLTVPCFYQTHIGYIVNMRYVYSIGKDRVALRYNGELINAYLTKRKYSQFKNTYLLFLRSIQ